MPAVLRRAAQAVYVLSLAGHVTPDDLAHIEATRARAMHEDGAPHAWLVLDVLPLRAPLHTASLLTPWLGAPGWAGVWACAESPLVAVLLGALPVAVHTAATPAAALAAARAVAQAHGYGANFNTSCTSEAAPPRAITPEAR